MDLLYCGSDTIFSAMGPNPAKSFGLDGDNPARRLEPELMQPGLSSISLGTA